jgi:hypothetical protein
MVRMALRGTSWSHLLDYASPALFDVIPARALLSQSRELFSNRSDAKRFAEVRTQVARILRERAIEIDVASGPRRDHEVPLSDVPEGVRHEAGQQILRSYFAQIFGSSEALLDLRAEKFTRGDDVLQWRPGALYVRWQPEFLEGVRDLYLGFYLDDDARFGAALRQLNMERSGEAMRNLLGRDDPRNTRFDVTAFHASFHELFVSYRDSGVALHRNFLPLGIGLMCLYDTLDSLDASLDVLAAVTETRGG